MPAWIHARAERLLEKNPDMPKSEAFGIATNQSHALGKSPKGYGTTEGRAHAKSIYKTPGDDVKTAGMRINYGLDFRPVGAHTHDEWLAGLFKRDGAFHVPDSLQHVSPLGKYALAGFTDELEAIAKHAGVLGDFVGAAKNALTTPIPGTPDLIAGKLQRVAQFAQTARQPPPKGSFKAFQAARAAAGH
jgi:hypothetical protein